MRPLGHGQVPQGSIANGPWELEVICQPLCLSPVRSSGSHGLVEGDLKEPGEGRAGRALLDPEQGKGMGILSLFPPRVL